MSRKHISAGYKILLIVTVLITAFFFAFIYFKMISNDSSSLPLIEISGNASERGLQHGQLLKERIHQTIEVYKRLFNKSDADILEKATIFSKVIADYSLDYADEIVGIAKGAQVDALWIYALNSRSEIKNMFDNERKKKVSECSAVFCSKTKILAQNWDWAEPLEDLAVIMRVISKDNEILMLTEPGIIGKIGMNKYGMGTTLNYLAAPDTELHGLPIHIVLRLVLDSKSLEDVKSRIQNIPSGQSGNVIAGSSTGKYANMEFIGKIVNEESTRPTMVHTNHFLSKPELNTGAKIENSNTRFNTIAALVEKFNNDVNYSSMLQILQDDSDENYPVCRKYKTNPETGSHGTVACVIMELDKFTFHYSKGNPKENKMHSLKILSV